MARIRIKLDFKELKRVIRALDVLGLSIYGSVYSRDTHQRHEACMDYGYKDIKTLAIKTAKFGPPEFVSLYGDGPNAKRAKAKKR